MSVVFKVRVQGQPAARFFWDFNEMVPVLRQLFADGSQQVLITVIDGDEGGDEHGQFHEALDGTGVFV